MADKFEEARHKLVMEERKHLFLTGIKKVRSFDPKEIILETIKGTLCIKGQELGIKNLNLEQSEVEIEGYVDAVNYPATRSTETSKSVWERIFK